MDRQILLKTAFEMAMSPQGNWSSRKTDISRPVVDDDGTSHRARTIIILPEGAGSFQPRGVNWC